MENLSCKTCKFLLPVYCHPWNQNVGKGSMSIKLGYVCTLFVELNNKTIFQETDTGLCECHTSKEENV